MSRGFTAHGSRLLFWSRPALGLLLVLLLITSGRADEKPSFYVIAHPSVAATSLPTRFVADAFLKKVTRWESGAVIHPVDLPSTSKTRIAFTDQVLRRSVAAVRSYWQQRIFSGRDVPPPEVDTESQVVKYVAGHPGALGYVSDSTELQGVKLIALH
ncbi:MAG TPA: hypothetical protein VN764_17905 [Polyangiaceae bacterium]|nr:hypothetical protein [Polyangiaceae bacterium]